LPNECHTFLKIARLSYNPHLPVWVGLPLPLPLSRSYTFEDFFHNISVL
jgi:hypothetical protein